MSLLAPARQYFGIEVKRRMKIKMNIQKLPWAGIRIVVGKTALAIDPITRILEEFGGAREPMRPLSEYGTLDAVLVTHLHEDHFDPDAVLSAYGAEIPVYVPADVLDAARTSGLKNITGLAVGESVQIGSDVKATALPSVDGLGDVQIAWVIEGGGRRVIHCGDTLWHGYWWKFADRYGPFDAAFLPVNGAVLELPGMLPSGQPICLTPEQAVAAADILQAERLVPIHYGTMHCPPLYTETPNIAGRLAEAAKEKVNLKFMKSGETMAL